MSVPGYEDEVVFGQMYSFEYPLEGQGGYLSNDKMTIFQILFIHDIDMNSRFKYICTSD